ncbi:MAG: tail fiber domain-containing protein [Candidatus Peribacteria bacterium]|nr:MAG: tail fiber domain-containing protein [Candidatus Peribacteria bacterium]
MQATAYYYSSDRRLKENITPIDNGLSLVQALQ